MVKNKSVLRRSSYMKWGGGWKIHFLTRLHVYRGNNMNFNYV